MLIKLASAGLITGLAAGGYAYAANWPTSQIFGHTVLAGCDVHEVALTFDDGPNDPYTYRLLELLARHGVRATFFLIGSFVRRQPEIPRAIIQGGHLLGNHTMSHPALPKFLVISALTIKIPDPIIDPATIIVASNKPKEGLKEAV